ncbi:MAG: carboxypeptidase regulatory-like domain-containing protein [Vicinamibacterales bacterium]
MNGVVIDESKAVLPGATVVATSRSTGRTFEAVTNERGEYRLVGMPPGRYDTRVELTGFATIVLSDIELLVGQNATIPYTMKLATLDEAITVTGEAPLIDLRTARVAGNIDRRQMEQLPINGRNWMQLSMMVPGITANAVSDTPGISGLTNFQLNLDGQEITQSTSVTSFGQPGISREAIGEYQVVTNMFDVTSGRSAGIQVQAVTRAGTNDLSGSVYGYFRDDKFNAADAYLNRVLPYSNSQVGATLGGPIKKNVMHFFGSYEREREPGTAVSSPVALAPQLVTLPIEEKKDYYLGRYDAQMGGKDHLVVRGNLYKRFLPNDGVVSHPSRGTKKDITSYSGTAIWSHVTAGNLLHELRGGIYKFYWTYEGADGNVLTPEYQFPGLILGLNWNYPEFIRETRYPFRYDLTWNVKNHDLKIGAEYMYAVDDGDWPARQRGQYFFSSLPPDAGRRFPLAQGPEAWDFSGLDGTILRFDQTYAREWKYHVPRPRYALWIGDTWKVNDRLTLNLGVRYDLSPGDFTAPGVRETDVIIDNGRYTTNVGYRNDLRDYNNIAPRVGFAWNVTGSGNTVIRGGSGLFYGHVGGNPSWDQQMWNGQKVIFNSYQNDRLPGFFADPTRGVTAEDILSGRVPLAPQSLSVIAHDIQTPYSWQTILGFQRRLTEVMAFDADLVFKKGYHFETQNDPNLFYDPATGLSKNPITFGRPRPDYGPFRLIGTDASSEYLALVTAANRRYRNRYQYGVTYTYMFFDNSSGLGGAGYGNNYINPFDISYNWGRSATFQRHTLRANSIVNLPWDVLLATIYQYGSGNYSSISSGFNLLGGPGANRFRRDGSFIPVNTFRGDPAQALDIRVSKEFRIGPRVKVTGTAEMFNVFNYKRYAYNLVETSAVFQRRNASAGPPRSGQLAFRIAF